MADIQGPTVRIGADASAVDTVLKSIPGKFQQLQTEVAGLGGKFEQVGQSMSQVGIYATAGITAPMAAAVGAVGLMTNQAVAFSGQMGEVYTLLPNLSADAKAKMSADVKALSSEYGIMSEDVVPALYQALSSGVPPENVMSFLGTAAQTSIGGCTDLTSAVDVLSSSVNAYGNDVLSAQQASDILFTGVKMGKTTMGELSANMSKVAPVAAALKIPLDQVVGSLDAMTLQGEPTAEAATKIKSMLAELSQEGSKSADIFEQLAGKSFTEFIKGGGTLQEALQLMAGASSQYGGSIKNEFGSIEAGMAALMLTSESGSKAYDAAMKEMAKSTGAMGQAYKEMSQTAQQQLNQLKSELHNQILEIGEAFLPILQNDILPIIKNDLVPLITGTVVPAIKNFADWFNKLDEPARRAAIGLGLFAGAIGPLLMVLGPIVSAGGSLLTGLTGIATAASGITGLGTAASGATPALAALFGPAGILAVGLGAGALAAYATNFGDFRDNINEVIGDIGRAASNIQTGNYEAAGRDMAQAVADGFETVGDLITKGIPEADKLLKGFISGLEEVARGAGEGFREEFDQAVNSGAVVLDQFLDSITQAVSSFDAIALGQKVGADIVSGISNAPANIMGFASSIYSALINWNWGSLGAQIGSLIASGIKIINPIVGGPLVAGLDGFLNPKGQTSEGTPYVNPATQGSFSFAGNQGSYNSVTGKWEIPKTSGSSSQSAAELLAKERDIRVSDAQKMLDSSDKLRAKYETQTNAQTAANKATESGTAAINNFTQTLTSASKAVAAPVSTPTNPDGSAFSGPGSSRAIDTFTTDPSRYFSDKLNQAAKTAGFDTVSEFESYLGEYGKTLKDKAREYFSEEKAAGFGGNWDFDAWFSEASKGISPAKNGIDSFIQSLSSFGMNANQAAVMQQKYNDIAQDGVAANGEAVDYIARFKQQTGDLTQYTQQNITETQGLLQAMIQAGQAQDQYTQYMSDGSLSAQEAADMNSRLADINRLLGDAGVTATGGVSGLPPALQSLASYAQSAATTINNAIANANAAVASAQSYVNQARSYVGQFQADTSVPTSRLSEKSISVLIKDNVFGQTTTANDVLRSAFSQISAGL